MKLFGVLCLACVLASCTRPTRAVARPGAPDIIFILADDLGWGDVGWHGSEIRTPHLDRLASEGARLEAHYAAPWCVPTRAALMSGRFPAPHFQVGTGDNWAMPDDFPTLPEVLRDQGYTTSLVGKWHLGDTAPFRPLDRGFDRQYGPYHGGVDYFRRIDVYGGADWYRDAQPLDEPGYETDLLGAEAVRQIGTPRTKPLFLQVCFNAPHEPLQVPDTWATPYAALRPERRRFAGMVACLDHWVGQLRAAIENTGRPTLILFQSDNGAKVKGGGSNTPLSRGKGTCYEGGIRVPAFAWWPGAIPARSVTTPTHTHDWLPTLCAVTGATPPDGIAGAALWPLLTGGGLTRSTLPIYRQEPFPDWKGSRRRDRGAVLEGNWKLLINRRGTAELYDLKADPGERRNLAHKQRAKTAELRALLP